jgi:adenylate cyclase
MAWTDDLGGWVDDILRTTFSVRDGRVVPDTDDVALKDGAVKLEAAFLYADLAGSSRLAQSCPWTTTAKIIRAYLYCATRLIRAYDGAIRSFDGDRVMGVFVGDRKNTHATYCAREIFWTVDKVIGPKAASQFKSVKDAGIQIRHGIGIDVGECRAVRAGIRNSNDLIWVGKPPSFAAKLSDVRDYPYSVYASARTYNKLADDGKVVDGSNIWKSAKFKFAGTEETVYKTNYLKTP